ncbi:hypothetical protein U3A55_09435 [Salarchaeum sp. III]|uniref:hypothetical protein n=1 Tax=Salarchaeum sp. III TaxID=3107927 RepID=UPI002ED91F1B
MSDEQRDDRPEVQTPDVEALRHLHDDTRSAIERGLDKHGGHASKAIRMVQVNGVVISIFVAGVTQVEIHPNLHVSLYLGAALLFASTLFALKAYRSQTLPIGISLSEVEKIDRNNLSETQYLYWYTHQYYPGTIETIKNEVEQRNREVEYSIFSFLLGILVIAVGILIQFVLV